MNRNRILCFSALAATALLASGCGEKPFLKVNGQIITKDEYISALEQTLAVAGPSGTVPVPAGRLVLEQLSQGIDRSLFSRLVDPVTVQEINLQRDSSGKTQTNFGADFAVAYLFAILLMLAVFTTNGYMMQTVIEEKETRLIEILISSMRPTQLLAGKILALGLLGLLQIVVWLLAIVGLGRLAAGSA